MVVQAMKYRVPDYCYYFYFCIIIIIVIGPSYKINSHIKSTDFCAFEKHDSFRESSPKKQLAAYVQTPCHQTA
jgi:hypothetical protein